VRPGALSLSDTIAALATPAGRSALAIVRVSGDQTRRILSAVTRGAPETLPARRPILVSLLDSSGESIDQGLLTFFPGPASATGEDVGELSLHGSPVIVEGVLEAIVAAGARPARPGEFSERAFLFGKIDLVRAEAIADLIDARTLAAARASSRRLEGKLSGRLSTIRKTLVDAAARLTAAIDFAEDVGEDVLPVAQEALLQAAGELTRLSATYRTGRLLSSGCRVAILGAPNAGKSTLFNALAGHERAIVTDVPGTTRDTLEAVVDIGGVPVELIDTAGLRDTDDPVESIGVERARRVAESAEVVLYVFDARRGWTTQDQDAVARWTEKPVLIVANKVDTLPSGVSPDRGTPLCGLSPGVGQALADLLGETVAAGVTLSEIPDVLGSLRQRDLIDRARGSAQCAADSIARGDSPEYAATHVNAALDALADLVGETTAEDVLERIFSTFCIGK
jgi:tRNA modification GTPase